MARISVTGHRSYRMSSEIDEAIAAVLTRVTGDERPPVVISSLAEGADRHVAETVLTLPGATLEVVLPLEPDDYGRDFASDDSRAHFAELLARATTVEVVSGAGTDREDAYELAGRTVVDRSDVLFAMWDGAPARGRGGTADIIQYALDNDVMVEVVLVERDPRT